MTYQRIELHHVLGVDLGLARGSGVLDLEDARVGLRVRLRVSVRVRAKVRVKLCV
jgi:hypothetical protein